MKALSVMQPHAERIARGDKRIEWRSWKVSYRGPLLIVASQRVDDDAYEEWAAHVGPQRLARGVAVCVVDLVDVVDMFESDDDDPDLDDPRADFAWKLRNPRRVRPVPLRGYAALYNVDDYLIAFA